MHTPSERPARQQTHSNEDSHDKSAGEKLQGLEKEGIIVRFMIGHSPQDMTDYDDERYCCSGADICSGCWPLMTDY